jgi:hypothetical protein
LLCHEAIVFGTKTVCFAMKQSRLRQRQFALP